MLAGDGVLTIPSPIEPLLRSVAPGLGVGMRLGASDEHFALGRRAAADAIEELGVPAAEVHAGPDGAPVWPAGVVGSIAHTGEVAVAVSARADAVAGVGIDVERSDRAIAAGVRRRTFTPEERAWVEASADPAVAALEVFCSKEALYKAVHPLGGRPGFQDVTFRARAPGRLEGELHAGSWSRAAGTIEARTVVGAGYVLAVVLIP